MHLIGAAFRADTMNLARLSLIYPGVVAAVKVSRFDCDGMDRLSRIAACAQVAA